MNKITSELIWRGEKYVLEYDDRDNFDDLPREKCQQVYGVCFEGDKLVLVFGESGSDGKGWGLVGGHIEEGESFEETLRREIVEETNMEMQNCKPIGAQKVISPNGEVKYQLRYAAKVKVLGKFEKDPAGSVTAVKSVDPKDYKQYFDWGEIGDRIMERAMDFLAKNE